jgi:transglutaminase-like putative cysteine protease
MLLVLFRAKFWLVTLFVTVCLTYVSPLFAQKPTDQAPSIKFGSIKPDQFTHSSTDSTAEAVVLYDYGEVTFSTNADKLWLEFTRHVRTHIQKKSAYDRATIQLPIRRGTDGQHEFVSNFEGTTYNLTNGTVSVDKIAKTGHFTEKISDSYWAEKYTLSNVREGSIIEYRYTVQTPFGIGYNPRTWRFQQDVPVNWSEYRITIPDYFFYKMIMGGYLPLLINEQKPTNVNLLAGQNGAGAVAYRFAMKNVPAFRDEAYITTDDDYLTKIDFELAGYQLPNAMSKQISVSWQDMDKTLLAEAEFGGQIKRAGFLHDAAKSILSQHPDTLSRVKAAYDYIRQTIKWNEETSLWSFSGIKKVFDNKKGSAADINLMLIALLREMDIEANPVILSTRSHGRIDESFALIKKFNYVVAQVAIGGKDMLLDATDAFLVPGMLPTRCLNGTGRLIHPTHARFVSLTPTERDNESFIGKFVIGEDGEISGTLDHSRGGYSAWSARKSLASEGKTKYLAQIQKKRPGWQIEQADFAVTDLKSNAFNAKYIITLPEACGHAGDRLYFKPMLTEAHGTNPFKETERLYPVDFGVETEETFIATYTLPKGYQVEEMPKAVSVSLPENGGKFVYQVVNTDNQLQIISRILLRRPMYYAEEYGTLRELFSRIVAKHAEQIVLKRGTVAEKK